MGKQKHPKKKQKVELVFDPKKRREYLTGFSKRKQERRKIAKEELEKKVKEERKRIKLEVKEGFQDQFKQSFATIELEGALREEEYETEDVNVQIVELSTDELAKSNNWIGANKPIYSTDSQSGKKPIARNDESDDEDDQDDNDDDEEQEEVPGFTVTSTKKVKRVKKVQQPDIELKNPDCPDEEPKKSGQKPHEEFKSKRAMGQFYAKKAQSTLKQSKAYQTKDKLERVRNKKKAHIEKEKRIKLQNKREKHKKKSTKPSKVKKFSRKPSSKNSKK